MDSIPRNIDGFRNARFLPGDRSNTRRRVDDFRVVYEDQPYDRMLTTLTSAGFPRWRRRGSSPTQPGWSDASMTDPLALARATLDDIRDSDIVSMSDRELCQTIERLEAALHTAIHEADIARSRPANDRGDASGNGTGGQQ